MLADQQLVRKLLMCDQPVIHTSRDCMADHAGGRPPLSPLFPFSDMCCSRVVIAEEELGKGLVGGCLPGPFNDDAALRPAAPSVHTQLNPRHACPTQTHEPTIIELGPMPHANPTSRAARELQATVLPSP